MIPEAGSIAGRVRSIIEPTVNDMGYRIVLIRLEGGDKKPRLSIMAEPIEDRAITLDECATISRGISTILEVEDPISSAYMLEVSSPGIDRPLVLLDDFVKYVGFDARIELSIPISEGRKRFKGRLDKVVGDNIYITDTGTQYELAYSHVANARLVLTDELIKFMQQKYKVKVDS